MDFEVDDGGGLAKRIVSVDHTSLNSKKFSDADDVENDGWKVKSGSSHNLGGNGKALSVEQSFDSKKVPSWSEQITFRGLFVSLVIGIIFSIIVMNINLTTGIAPTMNVSAGLLGFVFMRTWSKILEKAGFLKTPFTRQENTIIQTCVVACYGTAYAGGFGSYLLAMSRKTYELAGTHTEGNTADTTRDPSIGWMTGYLFLVTFLGILVLVPLRKVMIIDYRLTYPSGTATAVLINGFHTPHGNKWARKQVHYFGKWFTLSFLWGFFQWFFTGGEKCGFGNFPSLGLEAWKQSFYFDFSMTYVGAGMICPHLVNISMLLGAILSWGLMWPLINTRRGDWFLDKLPESSMQGLQGYKVFVAIALILGDGLYNFVQIMYITLTTMHNQWKKRMEISIPNGCLQTTKACFKLFED